MSIQLTALQPTEVDGYMIVANQLSLAVEALSKFETLPTRGCALLAAQALECVLKALICHGGKSFPKNEQHNLLALWSIAEETQRIDIPKEPPDWVKILSIGHGPRFYFRYQQGAEKNTVHGGQTPALIPMAQALSSLLKDVSNSIACNGLVSINRVDCIRR